jgi:hypothetical protein
MVQPESMKKKIWLVEALSGKFQTVLDTSLDKCLMALKTAG